MNLYTNPLILHYLSASSAGKTYTRFIRMLNTRCISKLLKMEACCIGKFPFSLFDLVEGPEGIFRIFYH